MQRDSWDGPDDLVVTGAGSSELAAEVTHRGPSVVVSALAVAAAALLGWLLVFGGGGGGGGGDGDAAEGDGPTGSEAAADASAASTTQSPSPTQPPATTVATTLAPTSMVPGAFLLGEPTGYWLFYGGADQLQRLDLDTGEVVPFGIRANPVAETGGDLVLYQESNQVIGWVSASDPGEQALAWKPGPAAPGPEPGQLWILDRAGRSDPPAGVDVGDGLGGGAWELFDLESARIVERRPGDLHDEVEDLYRQRASLGLAADAERPGPELSSRPDGVYLAEDGVYRRIGDGRVFAIDGEQAIVGTCGPGGQTPCELTWIDRRTGAALTERPLPVGRPAVMTPLAGGDWLRSIDWDGTTSLTPTDPEVPAVRLESGQTATISPDGRWLAVIDDALHIEDLLGLFSLAPLTSTALQIEDGGTALFVAKP